MSKQAFQDEIKPRWEEPSQQQSQKPPMVSESTKTSILETKPSKVVAGETQEGAIRGGVLTLDSVLRPGFLSTENLNSNACPLLKELERCTRASVYA